MKKPTADQTVRNLKPHIILYLEKEVPVSTETTFSDLLLSLTFEMELIQKIELRRGLWFKWYIFEGQLTLKDLRKKCCFSSDLNLLMDFDTVNFIAWCWTILDKWCQNLQCYLTTHKGRLSKTLLTGFQWLVLDLCTKDHWFLLANWTGTCYIGNLIPIFRVVCIPGTILAHLIFLLEKVHLVL